MTLAQTNWVALNALDGNNLRDALFSLIQTAAIEIQEGQLDDPTILATVPRIAEIVSSHKELVDGI